MEQLEEYEEHYFGCPVCAEEVKLGAVFLANVKGILGNEQDTRNR